MDTSTALTSVALVDGDRIVAQRTELDARRHAEVLAPLLRAVLADTGIGVGDVSTIACGVGPGPYTGLRVAIASARAIGLAWDRPVVGICSLDAFAAAVIASGAGGSFGVASDARRREVYWGWFDESGARILGPRVTKPDDIDAALRAGRWTGHGAEEHRDAFGSVIDGSAECRYPHASWIARRAGALLADGVEVGRPGIALAAHGGDGAATSDALAGVALLPPEPLYLRRPDAVESAAAARPEAGAAS